MTYEEVNETNINNYAVNVVYELMIFIINDGSKQKFITHLFSFHYFPFINFAFLIIWSKNIKLLWYICLSLLTFLDLDM